MNEEEKIKEFLTNYFCATDGVNDMAKYLNVEPELVAEMRAETLKDTDEGKEIYEVAMKILKQEADKIKGE